MERRHVSRASIEIAASSIDVWDALVTPAIAKEYFFGADVHSDWKEGSPITFTGAFNGSSYHEKGTILQCQPGRLLQYSHWSDLERLPDLPENYRNWTFRIEPAGPHAVLSVTEDNIPDETKRARSDELWSGVLTAIKRVVESSALELERPQASTRPQMQLGKCRGPGVAGVSHAKARL